MADRGRSRGHGIGRGQSRGGDQSRGGGQSRGGAIGGGGEGNQPHGRFDSGTGRGRGDRDGRSRGGRGDRGGGSRGGPPQPGAQMTIPTHSGPPPAGGIYLDAEPIPTPDATITAAENETVRVTAGRQFEFTGSEVLASGQQTTFTVRMPGRSSYGTQGRPIVLRTNYLKIHTAYEGTDKSIKETALHRYELSVTKDQGAPPKRKGESAAAAKDTSKSRKRRLVREILKDGRFQGKIYVTDFGNTIITTEKLNLGTDETPMYDIGAIWNANKLLPAAQPTEQPEVDPNAPRPAAVVARNTVHFQLKYDGSYSPRHMIEYLRSNRTGSEYAGGNTLIQLLNIIIAGRPQEHLAVVKVGSKFYPIADHPALETFHLGGGLEALRGYFASVRPTVSRLLLNLNVTSGAFYKAIPLLQLVDEARLRSMEQTEGFIRLLKIKVVYPNGKVKPKIKTIQGFSPVKRFGNAKEVTFEYTTNDTPPHKTHTTVFDYFRQHHGITLQQPNAPVINVGTKSDPQYLPMELCTVLSGQAYRRLLGGEETASMIKFVARFPNLNGMSIAGTPASPGNGVRLFRLAGAPGDDVQLQSVKPFGISVEPRMITVNGRILGAPNVTYGSKKDLRPFGGSWNLAGQKFNSAATFSKWQVMVINKAGRQGNALPGNGEDLFSDLGQALKEYGLTMGNRLPTRTITLNNLSIENRATNDLIIENAFDATKKDEVPIVYVVLPDDNKWVYARIKFHGDIKFGVHSICTIESKLQKQKPGFGLAMFFGNLALKFNIKGGGVSHKINNVLTKPLDNNTMLMGIDVTHPSPGSSDLAPSISCVVASVNEHLIQWPGSIRIQTGTVEMVQGLEAMVLERLALWKKHHNGRLPTKIVLYRDGVSEGQYPQVLKNEVPHFYTAFKTAYGSKESDCPKMAVVIVGKRHHTRFYPTKQEDANFNASKNNGSWNPLPGTVVDRGITGKILHEFYLQAHQGLQGTARPAHYVVIKDDIGFTADQLEHFTHNLCYLFNRATKAVSICPPAYYADLLCERGRAYLFSTLAENNFSDTMSMSSAGAAAALEWSSGVHPAIKDSTWYI